MRSVMVHNRKEEPVFMGEEAGEVFDRKEFEGGV